MASYLLDANALSELIREPLGPVSLRHRAKIKEPGARVVTSIISACEVRFGAEKKGSPRLSERVDRLLTSMEVVPLSPGVDTAYAVLRADLERKGQLIGPNDMLIAAHAIAIDAVLVTDNVREFKRVKGLRIENWLRA
jgi:tRNA(fMet)-specific endonuclease VapC